MQNLGKHSKQQNPQSFTAQRYSAQNYTHKASLLPRVVLLICLALAVLAGAFFVTSYLLEHVLGFNRSLPYGQNSTFDEDNQPRYLSPYNWEQLDRSNGRFTYFENSEPASLLGVDVSSFQTDIDWNAVAADGIDFAIVRLGNRGYTEGGLMVDEYATSNLDGAREAGLLVGAYFFSQAISVEEAKAEADFALEILAGRSLDLPIAFDHERVSSSEGRANNVESSLLSTCAVTFCETIEAAGYTTMIYGNARDMSRYDLTQFDERPLWHAEYNTPTPLVFYDIAMWQYTDSGEVAGIKGGVDLNILFTTAPQSILNQHPAP